MQSFIYFFMIFAMSLAADVYVYTGPEFVTKDLTAPRPVSCFSFGYHLNDELYMRIYIANKPKNVTGYEVGYQHNIRDGIRQGGLLNFKTEPDNGYYWFRRVLNYPDVKISLELYNSTSLCSTVIVAEGREISTLNDEITKKTYRDNNMCLQSSVPCVMLVDLKHACEDTVVTERDMQTSTVRMVTNFKNINNNTLIVPTSSPKYLETTTDQTTGNNTNAKSTNNTAIIVGSLSGVTFTLLAIIAIWKCCWVKHSPQGTPELPTNLNHQPFYVNMLFRRECDIEIAELEQHIYEEINPRVSEGS